MVNLFIMKNLYCFFLTAMIATNLFSQTTEKTIILIHGAWHGAWCWHKVVPLLEARGMKVVAIDLPSHGQDTTNPASITLEDYVKKAVDVANKQAGPVILVGHSMAGVVISQAAEILGVNKVAKLVYVDAFMPLNGESIFSLADMVKKQQPSNDRDMMQSVILSPDKNTGTFAKDKLAYFFYDDCSEEDIQFAQSHISVQAIAPIATAVHVSDKVYGVIPKYYILCTKAKDLDKTLISTHVPCKKIYRLPSSHSPFFSMPEKLVNILSEIYYQMS